MLLFFCYFYLVSYMLFYTYRICIYTKRLLYFKKQNKQTNKTWCADRGISPSGAVMSAQCFQYRSLVRRRMPSVKMVSRVTRLIRNFNVENRAHQEISKAKPKAAPRHPSSSSFPQEDIPGEKACQSMLDYYLCSYNCLYCEGPCPMSFRI